MVCCHRLLGSTGVGPSQSTGGGIMADRVTASVGVPVTLSALVQDCGEPMGYDTDALVPVGTEWILHQGPAIPHFDPESMSGMERGDADGEEGWGFGHYFSRARQGF